MLYNGRWIMLKKIKGKKQKRFVFEYCNLQ